jgi:hypothetical protein
LRKDSVVAHVVAALDLLEPNAQSASRAEGDSTLEEDLDGCRPSRMLEPARSSGLYRFSKPPTGF